VRGPFCRLPQKRNHPWANLPQCRPPAQPKHRRWFFGVLKKAAARWSSPYRAARSSTTFRWKSRNLRWPSVNPPTSTIRCVSTPIRWNRGPLLPFGAHTYRPSSDCFSLCGECPNGRKQRVFVVSLQHTGARYDGACFHNWVVACGSDHNWSVEFVVPVHGQEFRDSYRHPTVLHRCQACTERWRWPRRLAFSRRQRHGAAGVGLFKEANGRTGWLEEGLRGRAQVAGFF